MAVPLIVAPFAFEVPAIDVTVFTPAIIETLLALVTLPFVSTVKTGIEVEEPYVAEVTPDAAKVATPVTFPVPSKDPLVYVTSPVVEIVLPVVKPVAVPDKLPMNVVDVNEVNPVTDVTVPPKVIVVLPNVVALFANCALVIPALLDKLLVVNPVAEIVPPLIEIPEPAPAVNAVCLLLNVDQSVLVK